MRINNIFFLIMASISFHLSAQNDTTKCKTDTFEKVVPEQLPSKLIGKWIYSYSYYEDTCFSLPNLRDLSRTYTFKMEDTSMVKKNLPKFYAFAKKNVLFGLISYHEKAPWGKASSRPLVSTYDKSIAVYQITHYVGNGPGKTYNYFLESVNADTLVIRNPIYYHIGTKDVSTVRHVYSKQQ
jgi:hypothetical protein